MILSRFARLRLKVVSKQWIKNKKHGQSKFILIVHVFFYTNMGFIILPVFSVPFLQQLLLTEGFVL